MAEAGTRKAADRLERAVKRIEGETGNTSALLHPASSYHKVVPVSSNRLAGRGKAMAWLKSGISALRPQSDPNPSMDSGQYLQDVSREAQRAEMSGDRLRAEVAHEELNRELDNHRK